MSATHSPIHWIAHRHIRLVAMMIASKVLQSVLQRVGVKVLIPCRLYMKNVRLSQLGPMGLALLATVALEFMCAWPT